MSTKQSLGDGVWAEFNSGDLVLTVENSHGEVTDLIALPPDALWALALFMATVAKQTPKRPQNPTNN